MTLEDSIHSQRLRVLRDAERLGNVSEACRRHGLSRTLFYRLRQRLEVYGPDGVHPKRRGAQRGRPSALSVQTERRVIAFALAWPTCGPRTRHIVCALSWSAPTRTEREVLPP